METFTDITNWKMTIFKVFKPLVDPFKQPKLYFKKETALNIDYVGTHLFLKCLKFYGTSESPKLLLVEHVAPLGVYFFSP